MHYLSYKVRQFVYPNSLAEIHDLAKNAKKSTATVGTNSNDYTAIINKDKCNAYFVNYTDFNDKVQEIRNYCDALISQTYKIQCVNSETHFLYYKDQSQYWPHVDGQYLDGQIMKRSEINRDITCIVYLNDEYTGGELNFHLLNETIKPKTNDIVCFLGNYQYLHSVNPVIGERYAIVFWYTTTPQMYGDDYISDLNVLKTLYSTV
jgi:predicted 2-oxoglutarate/Fe(II)-dependent dioxygenase YbiX